MPAGTRSFVGRRESGGLGITDVLVVVLVAEAGAASLHGKAESIADGLVLVLTILFWSVAVDALAYLFPRLAVVLKAKARPLIEHGKLNHKVMRRELMTHDEVCSQLRLHGIENIELIDYAFIEPNGMISVIRRDGKETEPVEPTEAR